MIKNSNNTEIYNHTTDMKTKKQEVTESGDKPKRKTKKKADTSQMTTSMCKKSTSKKVDEPKSATVIEPQSTKVDWRDAVNPFKLSDFYTEDQEEINLISLLEMLSDTEDEDCDFETDNDKNLDSADEYDSWFNEIEARFDSVVDPILAKYGADECN